MRYLKTYNESLKKEYTQKDRTDLNELVEDIKNIMLDIIDEYELTDITPTNDDVDVDANLFHTPNSFYIEKDVKYTRHGAYGFATIKINCKRLYNENAPSMGKQEGLFKELILRLNTIGHSYVEFDESFIEMDLIEIEVVPKG